MVLLICGPIQYENCLDARDSHNKEEMVATWALIRYKDVILQV